MGISIRPENPADVAAIHRVNEAAFETNAEARLVDVLRANQALTLSLVAERDGEIVGDIAFSPVTVTREDGSLAAGIGLAPMAVSPKEQRKGVGSRLVVEGLSALRSAGHRFCVVLGHPGFYPRFGFVPAASLGLRWEHGHDEAFMAQELAPGGLAGVTGVVRYRPELDAV